MVTREVGGFLKSLSRAPEEHHVQAGQRAGSNWHIRQTTQLASNTNRKITQENWGRQTGRQTSAHKRRETHQPNNAISLLEIMLNTLLVCYVNKYSEKPTGVYINNKKESEKRFGIHGKFITKRTLNMTAQFPGRRATAQSWALHTP